MPALVQFSDEFDTLERALEKNQDCCIITNHPKGEIALTQVEKSLFLYTAISRTHSKKDKKKKKREEKIQWKIASLPSSMRGPTKSSHSTVISLPSSFRDC